MPRPPEWTTLVDSIRQDLGLLKARTGANLERTVMDNPARVKREAARNQRMMDKHGAWRRTDFGGGAPVNCDWHAARLVASRSLRSATATISAPRDHMSSGVGVATRTAVIRSTATQIISSIVDERRSSRAPAGPELSPGAARRQL